MAKDDIRVCEHLADRAASSDGRAVLQTASRGEAVAVQSRH
jgi:hypothetical protein